MQVQETYILQAETELRSEVAMGGCFKVTLIEGNAEIFGIEMALNREYVFSDDNVAIFTWYGCKLQTASESASTYVSDSTPMVAYVNTHMQLEARRDAALANQDFGPRVLLAGPSDSGKSTAARILAAYACRVDRTPLYVDLDVGQSALAVPGTICASPLSKFGLGVEEGCRGDAPLLYSLGYATPLDRAELYNKLVSVLAGKVKDRLDRDVDLRSSGVIVNTCGYIEDDGYDILLQCIQSFSIDIVLVMGHDRLYSALCNSLKDSCTVVKLPLSGGVVRRERQYRARSRQRRIKEYFYGRVSLSSGLGTSYSPARIDIQVSSVKFIRAGGLQLSENMRVMGDAGNAATQLVSVAPTEAELSRSILAVLHPLPQEGSAAARSDEIPQALLQSNVAGFLYVVSLNLEQDRMTVLSPCSGALPSRFLMVGSVKWDDSK